MKTYHNSISESLSETIRGSYEIQCHSAVFEILNSETTHFLTYVNINSIYYLLIKNSFLKLCCIFLNTLYINKKYALLVDILRFDVLAALRFSGLQRLKVGDHSIFLSNISSPSSRSKSKPSKRPAGASDKPGLRTEAKYYSET
jgi:hypothetical protein